MTPFEHPITFEKRHSSADKDIEKIFEKKTVAV